MGRRTSLHPAIKSISFTPAAAAEPGTLADNTYETGRRAYKAGIGLYDCPFTKNSPAWRSWRSGWTAQSCVVGPARA